jgi:O-antigen ligase
VALALCTLGVVASFARGAFLALGFVFLTVWLRSKQKVRTLLAGVVIGLIVLVASSVLFDEGVFWAEIMSVFEEGTTEGTGEDRWILWGAAWRVFLEKPVFGAGPGHWGVDAAGLFQPGELGGMYSNPGAFYDRSLHNLYMTTLSELGIVGSIALVWIVVSYFRRNAALRSEAAERVWASLGGRLKLRPLSFGLDAAMVAFLVNAAIYHMTDTHWLFTMLALNLMLHTLSASPIEPRLSSKRSHRQRLQRRPAANPPGTPVARGMPAAQDARRSINPR